MATQNLRFRLTATVAATSLVFAQLLPLPAAAQGQPPQPPPGAQDQQATGDPPERVGRLARVTGTVSFHTQDEDQWSPATANYPVTAGNSFWTDANAQAEIEVSASRVAMAPGTELDVATLSNTAFEATEPQGEIYLRVHAVTPDETYAVQTPRGLVTLSSPGRYALAAGDTQTPTAVTVIEGSAQIAGPDLSLQVGANQTATINGTDTLQGDVGAAQRDPFLTAMLDRERPPPRTQAVAPPPAVAAMPGGEDLAAYGTWTDSPQYGQVWYPQVAQDWVPYREGRWAYVAPWGWTWVDSDPWGFAPFHYGRWVQDGGRWGWYPGAEVGIAPVPVYAPALVTFFGVGAVVGIGVGAALAGGRIGWFPLGPREVYRPWYRASDRYVQQVNVTHVTNITTINRNVTVNNFANRGGATVVPTSALTESRPVRPAVQRVDAAQLAQARPVFGQQPLRPTMATTGVTPAVARQFDLRPTPGAVGQRPAAPGPAIRPAGVAPGAIGPAPGGRPALPPLHNPAQPTVPVAAGTRPFTGQPPLATPGARPAQPVPGGAPGTVLAPNTGRPAFGGPGTPQGAPALRPPAAPGQIVPPPIQHPPGGGSPAAVARPAPTPEVTGQPGALPSTGQPGRPVGPAAISRPGPQLTTPAPPPGSGAPAAITRPVPAPGVTEAPGGPRTGQPGRPAEPAAISRPAPQLAAPATPPAAFRPTAPPPAPVARLAPAPVARPAPSPPPPVAHAAPPPVAAVHAPPPPQVQAPPPPRVASPPPPQFQPPPPAARAPPPAPPPAARPAPPPPPAARAAPPPQQQKKKPGEL